MSQDRLLPLCLARRPVRWIAAAALAGIAATPALAQPRERTLYVTARDAQGAVVRSLTPEDLRVREDGVAREVLRVTPATTPMQIALLVDNSAATARHTMNFRDALKAFVARFPAPHEIALVTLGERPTTVVPFTTAPDTVARAVDRLFPVPGSGTYVLDGILEVSRDLQKREAERPVIVVVTTDGVEFSNVPDEPVLDAVRAAGAALHVVVVQENAGAAASGSNEMRYREIVFDRGTSESGGSRDIVLTSMALPAALGSLADTLLGQFAVTYARPTTLIPPERVRVEAARTGLQVRGTPARASKGERP